MKTRRIAGVIAALAATALVVSGCASPDVQGDDPTPTVTETDPAGNGNGETPPPAGDMIDLGSFKQSSGKVIVTYAVRGDFDLAGFHSNTFTIEWPKGSGTLREFPEMDRAEWMTLARAAQMLVKGQVPILQALSDRLAGEQAE